MLKILLSIARHTDLSQAIDTLLRTALALPVAVYTCLKIYREFIKQSAD